MDVVWRAQALSYDVAFKPSIVLAERDKANIMYSKLNELENIGEMLDCHNTVNVASGRCSAMDIVVASNSRSLAIARENAKDAPHCSNDGGEHGRRRRRRRSSLSSTSVSSLKKSIALAASRGRLSGSSMRMPRLSRRASI